MGGWMRSLLTFQPITTATSSQLLSLYIQYTVLGFLFATPWWVLLRIIGIPWPEKKSGMTMGKILWIVPTENLLFRAIPLWIWGANGAIFAHILWALIHGSYAFPLLVLHGLLELRLWLGGLWIQGFLLHLFHDLFLALLLTIVREFK